MQCEFRADANGVCRCVHCDRAIPVDDCAKLHANCRVGRSERIDKYACLHRGAVLGKVKCECGTGTVRYVDYYACAVHQRCMIGERPRQEPERSMFVVCASCDDREPPLGKA